MISSLVSRKHGGVERSLGMSPLMRIRGVPVSSVCRPALRVVLRGKLTPSPRPYGTRSPGRHCPTECSVMGLCPVLSCPAE